MIKEMFEPIVEVEAFPKGWRGICPYAFKGCEGANVSIEILEETCQNNFGDNSCFANRFRGEQFLERMIPKYN